MAETNNAIDGKNEKAKKDDIKKVKRNSKEPPVITTLKKLIKPLHDERQIDQLLLCDDITGNSYLNVINTIKDLENQKDKEIDLIIHSSGGSAEYAYRIIRRLRESFKSVNIIVPFWAKSAATLLSLGGSVIIMDESAELGPLDAQIIEENSEEATIERESVLNDESSLANLEERAAHLFMQTYIEIFKSFYRTPLKLNKSELSKQVLEFVASFYQPLLNQIDPYKMGKKRRIAKISIEYIEKILNQYNPINDFQTKNKLKKFIVYDCPNHGFIVDFHTISKYLQNVVRSDTINLQYSVKLKALADYLIDYRISIEENGPDGTMLNGIVLLVNGKTKI